MEYNINNFVETLLQKKGITGLSENIMSQMKEDLLERAENLINAEIINNMPEYCLEEFEKKLDEGDTSEIYSFCKKYIPNLDEVIASALFRLQQIYLKSTL